MKIFFFVLSVILLSSIKSYAQNTFPATGNVGIGTTAPTQLLDVTGTGGSFNSTAKVNALFVQDHTNYKGVYLGFDSADQIGVIGAACTGTTTPSNLAFWNHGTAGWTESMRINSDGNVGIGTKNFSDKLTVNGNVRIMSLASNTGLFVYDASTGGNSIFSFTRQSNNLSIAAFDGMGFSVLARSGASTNYSMFINTSGNVSIGTTDGKGYKFAVNGSAIATSMTIKLNANWPDYVFKKGYRLRSLAETKSYIDQHLHLPEMPSAKEIETNGQNLGEINQLLTKKVEELTLYLIENNKKQEEQEIRLKKLEQELKALRKK